MHDVVRRLDRALSPRVVAVVGDKKVSGYNWLKNQAKFTGKLYSVQIDPNEIPGIEELGIPNYKSLVEIPDEVDLVICAVPRQVAPRVVADAAAKKVGGIAMFTSGFAETGEELGVKLQDEILRIAREHDLLIVGPNCMGIYNARLGVRFSGDQPAGEGGGIGFISQSGTHAINTSLYASSQGLLLSKAISIGNAIVIDAADCLEYFAADPETKIIGLYVEGVRDGRRFMRVLAETARQKPVVVWKGGRTSAGQRATQSHTASLASQMRIWDAMVRQTGAIPATSLDDMIDMFQVLQRVKPVTGGRMGLMAQTGGQSVVFSDAFEGEGLSVPLLEERSYTELATFFNIVGGSYRNPLDMAGTTGSDPANLDRLFRIMDEDANIDAVAMEISATFMARRWTTHPDQLDHFIEQLAAHRERSAKPFLTVLHPIHLEAEVAALRPRFQQAGIAVLPGFDRAARAMRRALDYHRFRADIG
jgi:acyl-CoA synthetase (NDP forming)